MHTCIRIMFLQFHESEFVLRSQSTHAIHCADLNGPLHDHAATTYGVACDSILNTSAYFHVTDGMIPDIMHDVLEGSLQLHIKWLFKHCIQQMKYFPLDCLNTRIHSFYFGTADATNRPSVFAADVLTSSNNSVKQSCTFYNYLYIIALM